MKKNIILMVAGILLIFFLYVAVELLIPLPFGNRAVEFEIKKGTTFRQVVEGLSKKRMVRDKWVFLLLGRITGIDRKIKAGYYPLWGSMSPFEIFDAFRLGSIIEYEITIVPGDSLREIAEKFSSLGIIEGPEFLRLSTDRDFLDIFNIDAPSLEGYLFPDTYRFPKGLEVKEVLSMMIANLREKYDAGMQARTLELGLTERDVLTMASIIEKEAVTDSERPIIAAVYYNRLKKNMPLQADPTAIYGIKSHKERITKQDLMRKTPYNTYVIKGLPPGPIASPGLKSIKAALYPAEVSYLYFVSNNDGTHNFSVTLNEHAGAVKAYRNKKKDAASQGAS
ncbi:MAG: endolytic transglycosylase MltG [Thermodesulfovibrionales bacterium]